MQEAPPQRWPGAIATLGVLLLLIGAALLVTYVLRLP